MQKEIAIPPIVEDIGFADQENEVQRGVDGVDLMHQWCLKHERFLRSLVDDSLV